MAKRSHVMQKYTPRIKLDIPIKTEVVGKFIEGRTSITSGTVKNVVDELATAIVIFSHLQQPIKFEGLGIFRPIMARDGSIRVSFVADRNLVKRVNAEGLKGIPINNELIGLTEEELIAKWNEENPDDPVED